MNPQPFDINAYIQAMLQLSQQQQQGRTLNNRENMSGRHLGMGGADISDSNPTGNVGNPFSSGFFQSSASQLTPEARLASQGNNAMNQWGQAGQVQGVDPTRLASANNMAGGMQRMNPMERPDYGALASGASQSYHPSPDAFQMPPPLTSPQGNAQTDALNLQQNQQMYSPGGMTAPAPMQLGGIPPMQFPQQPMLPRPQQQPPGNFGATARPGRSFGFGGGMR